MSYIQKFKEKFPDKVTPEMILGYHGGNVKIGQFNFNSMLEHNEDVSGVLFLSDENDARKKGKYVTKAQLKMGRLVSTQGPPKRSDIAYMITHAPGKEDTLNKFDKDPREAYFKATDHILKGGSAYKCYKILATEFYKNHAEEFAKNMIHIGYDGVAILKGDKIYSYIVFNPKCIQIIKQ